MSINRSPSDVLEPEATPELFALVSKLIRRSGRAALATTDLDTGLRGAIVRVTEAADGAPTFSLPREDEQARHLLRDGRVGLLVADIVSASSRSNGVRVTLVGVAVPSYRASTITFRLQIERIRFTSPARSAWYRVAIHPSRVH